MQLSDDVLPRARTVLRRERRRLKGIVAGELVLTGGASVPGALTVGDIDLHLRVPPPAFATAVDALQELYDVALPEIWTETLATYVVRGEDVGIAVTPIGSVHDRRFTDAWQRLRTHPELLAEYNEMKRRQADADEATYLAAKAEFFDGLAAEPTGSAADPRPA
jgi:GrpB-like predicted nucleotidyltransferase (UPF0157 family)